MKIMQVKFYQGVRVDAETLTSFTPDEMLSDAGLRRGRRAEMAQNGVVIKGNNMDVLVPWNNVAYVQYEQVESPKLSKIK